MSSPRPDTRLLTAAPVAADLGQRLTNITAAGLGAYEAPSARTALDGSGPARSLEILVNLDQASAGTLLDHGGDTGTHGYRIDVSLPGGVVTIDFIGQATKLASIAAPGAGALAQPYVIAWSTEPNPATTGAADALRSEMLVYDATGAALAWAAVAHAVFAADPAAAVSLGGSWTGAILAAAYPKALDGCRISARWHGRAEVREHWVAQTPAPAVVGITAVEGQLLPSDTAIAKSIAGPQYQAGAASMRVGRNRHRLTSPSTETTIPDPPSWVDDLADTIGPTRVLNLEGGYQVALGWVWRRRIPRMCGWVLVHLQLATWDDDAQPPDLTEIRIHAADGPPVDFDEEQIKLISRSVDDGTDGVGVQLVFDPLYLRRDEASGYTWLWLSARTDGGSGAGNAVYSIREVSIVPMSTAVGAVDNAPPGDWDP